MVKVTNTHSVRCSIVIDGKLLKHGESAIVDESHVSKVLVNSGMLKVEPVEEEKPVERELSDDEKIERIKDAIAELGEDDFTSSGKPMVDALSEKVGFSVTAKMRDKAMQ